MRFHLGAALAILVCGQPIAPAAQTELDWCGMPPCVEAFSSTGLFIDCPGYDSLFLMGVIGRWWWGPLVCVGPIRLSVQVSRIGEGVEALPLVFEARRDPFAAQCQFPPRSWPGPYLWHTYGGISCDPDSLWEESPLIELPSIVPLGETYWLQMEGFQTHPSSDVEATSPYFACIRLRTLPTQVTAATWGSVKSLYK